MRKQFHEEGAPMSSKKDPVLVALGDCPKKWNKYLLKTYGYSETPQPRDEVSESAFVTERGSRTPLEDVAAHQIRLGEEPPKGLFKVWAEHSGLEGQPTEQWKRSQAFMQVMGRIYAHVNKLSKENRAELVKDVENLRPDVPLVEFPEELGTSEQFFYCWQHHEYDVEFVHQSRKMQRFQVWRQPIPLPPDEPEHLDEAGEPPGHWEGPKWIPDTPKKSDS
jgi:hypothetical protein